MGHDRDVDVASLSREELEEHALALRTVLSVSEAIHRSTDYADLVERTLDAIVLYTRLPSVGLFRVDHAAGKATLVGARGFTDEVLATARSLPLDGSLTGEAVRRSAVVTSFDLGGDPRIDPATGAALVKDGFVEVACVPILFRDEVVGSLNLIYRRAARLSEHERFVLLALGKTIGIAMKNHLETQERRSLEEQVRRAQQLETLGGLAAGIAHDFNNLLVGILGNISLAREAPGGAGSDALADAETSSKRASALVQRLLTFARGGGPLSRPTERLVELVKDAAELAVSGLDVSIDLDAPHDVGVVAVDRGQIAQVVQNLALNAAQASRPGAQVVVRVERIPDPPMLRIAVSDDGQGVPPDVLPRIFEPYFSTRGRPGLGLSVVDSIVRRHGGTIDVKSRPGLGSVFTVTVPAHDATAPHSSREPTEGLEVLVVDDEARVRSTLRRVLSAVGIEVTEAASCDEAVSAYSASLSRARPFSCVILDLTLAGGPGGVEILGELRKLDPQVRAVVSSGYSDDNALAEYERHGFVGVLPKPYTVADVRSVVRAAAASRPGNGSPG